jgi:DNA-binding transcriptional LysR family regulator
MRTRSLTLGELLEVNSREAVREAVAAGFAIGVVSESEFGSDRRLVPFRIEAEELAMTECAARPSERRDLSLVRAFLDILERQVAMG